MDIHIGNLAPATSLIDLRGRFEVFGAVTDIEISTYMVGNRLRSFGFIEMPSNDHGKAAIDGLQGSELAGNRLSIKEE